MYVLRNPGREPSVFALMACGAASSSVGQLASYPLALVRTRMQVCVCVYVYVSVCESLSHTHTHTLSLFQANDTTRGMIAEFEAVVRAGGVAALYRGLVPNFLKVAPAVSISYVIYERMRRLLQL